METTYQYIITGVIIALAIIFLVRKIKNTIKGGGCGCGCGCNNKKTSTENNSCQK